MPDAQPKPTAADVLRLDHLLGVFRVGSGDWSWREEHDLLYARPWQAALTQQIATEGIREPVLLGNDGRIWDGHHRICAAMHLGLDVVPVEWAGSDRWLAEHDAQVAARAWAEGVAAGAAAIADRRQPAPANPYQACVIGTDGRCTIPGHSHTDDDGDP